MHGRIQEKLCYECKLLNRSTSFRFVRVDFATAHLSRNETPNGAHFARNNYAGPIYVIYLTLAISTTSYQFINIRESACGGCHYYIYVSLMTSRAMKNRSFTLLVVDSGLMSLPVRKI